MKYRIEAITLPVTDIDRAKAFYEQVGFGVDIDTEVGPGMRLVQLTPPGSGCSVLIGSGLPQSEPGSYVNTYLVVSDIEVAHRELTGRGVPVGDIFHFGDAGQAPGLDPQRGDYGSYAAITDPDGNSWLLQEVPSRASSD